MALGKHFSSHLAHSISFRIKCLIKLDLSDRHVSQVIGPCNTPKRSVENQTKAIRQMGQFWQ